MIPLSERFAQKVAYSNDEGCWEWTGAINNQGYGSIYDHDARRAILATHAALKLDGRPRPSRDMHALHACDNPSCVNPRHLRWGTHVENMNDMRERGRLNISGFAKFWATPGQKRRKTHCKKGHLLAGANLYVSPGLKRMCAQCAKERKRIYRNRLFDEPPPKPVQATLFDEGAA